MVLLRNAGNIVPPYGAAMGGESATIEYAVSVLKMKNIIICGHYHCGAMSALMKQEASLGELPAVRSWFAHAEATRRIVKESGRGLPIESQVNLAIERNVLVQIDNLRTHPSVAAAVSRGELNIYGWIYRIETGDVLAYEPDQGRFALLGEQDEPHPYPIVPQLSCCSAVS